MIAPTISTIIPIIRKVMTTPISIVHVVPRLRNDPDEEDRGRLEPPKVHARSGDSCLESTLESAEAARACGRA
jgi:hypothetical protein